MNLQQSIKLCVTRQIMQTMDADFEREKISSPIALFPYLCIYIFFLHQQWQGFNGIFENESRGLEEAFAHVCGIPYILILGP